MKSFIFVLALAMIFSCGCGEQPAQQAPAVQPTAQFTTATTTPVVASTPVVAATAPVTIEEIATPTTETPTATPTDEVTMPTGGDQ